MKLADHARLVMTGDSITDCGRARPVGENNGLGAGYVSLVNALLLEKRPEAGIHVMNTGISGHQVPDLLSRWQEDVLNLRPDYVSILIGINDVWRQFDCPNQPEKHVSPKVYRQGLEKLVRDAQSAAKGVIVMAPYIIETNPKDAMRQRMDEYGALAKEAAEVTGALFIDTQAAFDRVLQHMHPYYLAWDRIHPGTAGHMVIAKAFVDAVG